jgi:DNA-directed RNA polymerase specialized sigma24 family protein
VDEEEPTFVAWEADTVERSVSSAARITGRRFHQWAERDDMASEAWVWILKYPGKVAEYEALGEPGRKKLVRALINACTAYAAREKAERSGYRAGDNHYYSTDWLKVVIPVVLDKGLDVNAPAYADWPLDTVSGRYERAEWLDVVGAIQRLSESEYEILWRAFLGDPEEEAGYLNVAEFLSLNYDAARQRVYRVLRKLQSFLGGPDPVPKRKSKSNAQASAETRSQYEGQ